MLKLRAVNDRVASLLQVLNSEGAANSPAVVVDQLVGQAYRYSGGSYEIAQQMMIDATGVRFATLVHDEVLAPLRHDATGAAIP